MATKYIVDIERLLQLGILVPAHSTAKGPPDTSAVSSPTVSASSSNGVVADEDARYVRFLRFLPRNEAGAQRDVGQRDILGFIMAHPGTTAPAIAEHFEIHQRQVLGKINGGLQKNIKKAGFVNIDPILWLEKRGGKWHYFPGEVLKRQSPIPL